MTPEAAPRRATLRFQAKILLLLAATLLATLVVTLGVVELAVSSAVDRQVARELAVGSRVWESFHAARRQQLVDSVAVLADDFGFRAAAATADAGTVQSALDNHGQRVGADIGVLLTADGEWLAAASGTVLDAERAAAPLRPLHRLAEAEGRASGTVVLDGRPYLVAMVPVNAPVTIAWVAMGRALDAAYLEEFHTLSGLHVALARGDGDARRLLVSSRAPGGTLLRLTDGNGAPEGGRVDGGDVVARRVAMPGAGDGMEAWLLASRDEVFAPFRRVQEQIIAVSVLAALLAIAVAVAIGRGVSRPVAELAEAARRIGSGDYTRALPPMGRDELGELASAFNGMQSGIAEREQQILHQARHDGLTDLPNRTHALSMLGTAITRAGGCTSCAVVLIDLDRFKEINDTLGHGFGDRVLVLAAQRLKDALAAGDLLARLGGDEFLVVMEGVDTPAALERAGVLAGALRDPLHLGDTQVSLDASIGVAMYPEHGREADMLLRRADIAMYDAKDLRGGVVLYQPGRDEIHLRQLTLLADLRPAIAHGELDMVFQPKIDLATGQVAHAEALVRWAHPELGKIGPDEFVPLAERSGLIHALTRFVLDRGLGQLRAWSQDGLDIALAVNISSIDLLDAAFPEHVLSALAQHSVPANRLIIEITESTLMRDLESAVKVLRRLREAGVRLSIDDFGTGHSSLAQLRGLPVDEIKIDKSFVMRLTEGSEDAVIVRSAIEIGHNMGLRVIAEGVETADGLAVLRRLHCDMAQGFLFSPPLHPDAFVQWCRHHAASVSEVECGSG